MEIHQERSVKVLGLQFSCKADLRVDPPGKKPTTPSTISFHFTGYKGRRKGRGGRLRGPGDLPGPFICEATCQERR